MCRLLGITTERATDFSRCLRDAPRSLAALSQLHPDGWGIGVWTMSLGWRVAKSARCAKADGDFDRVVRHARGQTLVAHIRKRTVGDTAVENCHPFAQGKWIFAHNGTVHATDKLREQISPTRLDNVRGQTDSELIFAYLLTHLDTLSPTATRASVDRTIATAVANLDGHGSTTFLLSDGVVIYAHRNGRSLYSLVRNGEPGAVLFASERVTDEAWEEVPEGSLLRVTRKPTLAIQRVNGPDK
ncbi:MAG TPA: class II glutamine amidotransferase [Polyangiaceae bacterium]|nr:class II glutamine amidotransferase [Polyangiaceae bacterium]